MGRAVFYMVIYKLDFGYVDEYTAGSNTLDSFVKCGTMSIPIYDIKTLDEMHIDGFNVDDASILQEIHRAVNTRIGVSAPLLSFCFTPNTTYSETNGYLALTALGVNMFKSQEYSYINYSASSAYDQTLYNRLNSATSSDTAFHFAWIDPSDESNYAIGTYAFYNGHGFAIGNSYSATVYWQTFARCSCELYVNGEYTNLYGQIPLAMSDTNYNPLVTDLLGLYDGEPYRIRYGISSTNRANLFCESSGSTTDTLYISNIYNWLNDNLTPAVNYDAGGYSETSNSTGTFSDESDEITIPDAPTLTAVSTSFITLFAPDATQLNELADYMWSTFDLDSFRKIFANPMDCILGMSIVPVTVPTTATSAVTVGNISTGVYLNIADSQYIDVDCGSLDIEEYWGAYLDYAPYTKAEICLPYCGTHAIDIDDIMGKTVQVYYRVDILSGSCCAYIKCDDAVLYTFIGHCSSPIPITGNDWSNVVNGALSIAGSIGTMIATGGATAPMAVGMAGTAVNSFKPSIEKSGSLSGTGGMMGIQTPYLIITRPRQCLPENNGEFNGYPSFITMQLSDCSGYTEVDNVHLSGIDATDAELNEIENLLKGGVII